jgi:hypothetical protein
VERIRQPAVADAERCSEPGCDRVSAPSDGRCALHASRLGPLPSEALAGVLLSDEATEVRPKNTASEAAGPLRRTSAWGVAARIATAITGTVWVLSFAIASSYELKVFANESALVLVVWGLAVAGFFPAGFTLSRARGRRQVLLSVLLVTVSLVTCQAAVVTTTMSLRPLFQSSASMLGGASDDSKAAKKVVVTKHRPGRFAKPAGDGVAPSR